jgi:26S proteasome regulatory subunit N11
LLGVDINTQQSFEALSERAVAVVVDPIQSVKGKVVIDAFRLINPNMMVLGQVSNYFLFLPSGFSQLLLL